MTRDYARKAPVPRKTPPLPPWLWIMTGLLIGLFVAFLMYINQPQGQRAPAPSAKAGADKPAARSTATKPGEDRLRFDFYRILPEYEVVIPQEDLARPEAKLPAVPGKYIVQAGSFRRAGDADTRRAQLALLGLVSRVQTVTVDEKDTWHRVQVGPYEEMGQLDRTRELLQDNDIEFIILKVKE